MCHFFIFSSIVTTRKLNFGKVMFLHLSASHSVHILSLVPCSFWEGSLSRRVSPQTQTPRQNPPKTQTPDRDLPGQRSPWTEISLDRDPLNREAPGKRPPWTETPPYGKERAICILLECILVLHAVADIHSKILDTPAPAIGANFFISM